MLCCFVTTVLGNFTDEFHAVGAECKDDRAIPLDSGAIVVMYVRSRSE